MSSFIDQEFGAAVEVSQSKTACGTGAFEVTVNRTLVHSKLTMGHGKCQTDEELDGILEHIKSVVAARA